ncbi:MAG: IclR family transcriptional regulator, acetate operon repressor [Thermomicrobiales bacterium]|nr:IclR family transcriptional regulator, acetate operon repressor [Thermomicrobiales bacterium]
MGEERTNAAESRPAADGVGTVQSVQRALQLLSLFAPHRMRLAPRRTLWTVSDLARATGLHKSVVARLMATMALDGFVVQDPATKAYRIGPQAFAVGSAYEPLTVLDRVARPVMTALTERCGHASYLGVPAGSHWVFLIAVESPRSVRVTIEVGENRYYHSDSIGKSLLSGIEDEQIRVLVGPDPLPKVTPNTIDRVQALLAEVARVRSDGVAFNREESIVGAGSVAVPIRDGRGAIVAGLSIVYPTHIVTAEEVDELKDHVRQAGAQISQQLGTLGG